jgi:hypothetical protein
VKVCWWNSILLIKKKIQALVHEPPSRIHLYHSTYPYELRNSIVLHDVGIEKGGMILRAAIDHKNEGECSITPYKTSMIDAACKQMICYVRNGFFKNRAPTPTDEFDGSGGVYFLRNGTGQYCAVFKPYDEEQGMPNNPKDYAGQGVRGLRDHFLPGEGCLREYAAYLLDYDHFCDIPPTTLVNCEHASFFYPKKEKEQRAVEKNMCDTERPMCRTFPKLGSLQLFVKSSSLFEDIGQSLLRC